jgi:hypothetical protein
MVTLKLNPVGCESQLIDGRISRRSVGVGFVA